MEFYFKSAVSMEKNDPRPLIFLLNLTIVEIFLASFLLANEFVWRFSLLKNTFCKFFKLMIIELFFIKIDKIFKGVLNYHKVKIITD